MSSAILVSNLRRRYGSGSNAVDALRDVDLTVERGEIAALTGPSGSGKTTLLNCLLGLDRADSGTVEIFGQRIDSLDYEAAVAWRREHVAIMFQNPGLLPHLTAAENIDLVLRMRHVDRVDRPTRVAHALERMQIGDFADHRPGELSGGQRQRVALARSLAAQPPLVVADEPTGELDPETTQVVLEQLVAAARTSSATVLIATHDPEVTAIADRQLHLVDGQLVTP